MLSVVSGLDIDKTAKTADSLKPITIFALIAVALIGFLIWDNVSDNKLDAKLRDNSETLKLHHAGQVGISQQLDKQTAVLREICVSLARQTGRDERPCYN